MTNCCIDEKQIEIMKDGFRDVGKWVYYILKAARVANVPWSVLKEGVIKAGAYDAYALYPRTGDLKELAEVLGASDMMKAYDGKILFADENRVELELGSNPMLEMAAECTDDAAFLLDLNHTYLGIFEGIFATYGLQLKVIETPDMGNGRAVLAAVR